MSDIFSWSAQTTEKNQVDGFPDPDAARSDISTHGGWTTTAGRGWQVTTAANFSGGLGGCGFRTWRGDGNNNVSGAITISPPPRLEIWVRSYRRYQAGMDFTTSEPVYIKEHYWQGPGCGSDGCVIVGHEGGAFGINYNNSANYPSSVGWVDLMGGQTGDGLFHCFEYYVLRHSTNGALKYWIDGVLVLDESGIQTAPSNSENLTHFLLGENATTITGGGANDFFIDEDDIVISDSGRVGLIGGGGGDPGPTNNALLESSFPTTMEPQTNRSVIGSWRSAIRDWRARRPGRLVTA